MRTICNFSGGLGSWAAAKIAGEVYGLDTVTLLMADTLVESDGLYRFAIEGAANVFGMEPPPGCLTLAATIPPLDVPDKNLPDRKLHLAELRAAVTAYFKGRFVWLADGRTPWETYRDARFLGNSRVDPCSKDLKRTLLDQWLSKNCSPATTRSVVGLGAWERHRMEGNAKELAVPHPTLFDVEHEEQPAAKVKLGLRERMSNKGWVFVAPLIEHRPMWDRADIKAYANREGLELSDSYDSFQTDNCSGACCKSGMGQWKRLYRDRPDIFQYAKAREEELRTLLGNVAMLRDRSNGLTPLPLIEFEKRIEAGEDCGLFGDHQCGCFTDYDDSLSPT